MPAGIEDLAVFAEPLAVAEKGINEAHTLQRARLGETCWTGNGPRVLVTGMGPIGFAAVIACVARNPRRCTDVVWADCAARIGPHADGGPPAPPPPPDEYE